MRRYQEIAFRTAFLITGASAEAEDAAQEGFIWEQDGITAGAQRHRSGRRVRLGEAVRSLLGGDDHMQGKVLVEQ